MKKYRAILSIALGTLLLAGCGQASPPLNTSNQSPKIAANPAPYASLTPLNGAKSLQAQASQSDKKNMTSLEAKAYIDDKGSKVDIRRSVPLGWTLETRKEDLSNGPLKHGRIVAFYGNPLSSQMGVLGQGSTQEMFNRLKNQAQAYSTVDPASPAIPALELIASVSQRNPGPKGLYVTWTPNSIIERYAKLAQKNKALLILDVQLGRDAVMNQVKYLQPFLKLPNVELAIDTEFHVSAGQIPGEQLGHVNGSEIQSAIEYINRVVEKNHLPDKVVMVHQFDEGIVIHKEIIKPTNHVEVALNADGFGSPSSKLVDYINLVRNEPIQYGGFKLFYSQDHPLLSPKEVVSLDPAPAVVDYQ